MEMENHPDKSIEQLLRKARELALPPKDKLRMKKKLTEHMRLHPLLPDNRETPQSPDAGAIPAEEAAAY